MIIDAERPLTYPVLQVLECMPTQEPEGNEISTWLGKAADWKLLVYDGMYSATAFVSQHGMHAEFWRRGIEPYTLIKTRSIIVCRTCRLRDTMIFAIYAM